MEHTTPPSGSNRGVWPHGRFDDSWHESTLSVTHPLGSPYMPLEGPCMHIPKTEIPVRIDVPGAVARQKTEFGDANGYGKIAGELFLARRWHGHRAPAQGLEDDLCQSPHWGYLLEGEVTVTYKDGKDEDVSGGDLFYWPPGHTVKVSKDAEIVLLPVCATFALRRQCSVGESLRIWVAEGWRCLRRVGSLRS